MVSSNPSFPYCPALASAAPTVAAAVPQLLGTQAMDGWSKRGSQEGKQQAPLRGRPTKALNPGTARATSSGDSQPGAEGRVHFADDFKVSVPAPAASAGPEHPGLSATTASGDGGPRQLRAGRTDAAARDASIKFGDIDPETISLGNGFGLPLGHKAEAPVPA